MRVLNRSTIGVWTGWAAAVAIALVAGGQVPAAQSAAAADAWPQFRGHHALTGVSPSTVPDTLKLLWTYEAGDAVESSPAIVNGTVYVGAQPGSLVALDLGTGRERWTYPLPDGASESSPAVAGGLVYIGDLGGTLHAVSAADGKAVWTFKTDSEIKSSPVAVDGRVLIGSYDAHLYALAADSGKLLWKVQTEGFVHATPGVAAGIAYVAGCDESFRGIRISDGVEVFRLSSGAYTGASPALRDDAAFFGTFNNEVLRIDLTPRRVAWRYEHPDRHFPFNASAAVTANRVVVGGRDKMVHALDPATGRAVWTFVTGARVESSPAVAGNRVYVGSNDGRFYVLDLATGAKRWEFNAGDGLSSSPAIASGRIVIGTLDGRVLCFG